MICIDNIDVGTELFYVKTMVNINVPREFVDDNGVEWIRKCKPKMYIIYKAVVSGKEVNTFIGDCGPYDNGGDITYYLKYDNSIIDIDNRYVSYLFYTAEDAENAVKHLVDYGKLPEEKP